MREDERQLSEQRLQQAEEVHKLAVAYEALWRDLTDTIVDTHLDDVALRHLDDLESIEAERAAEAEAASLRSELRAGAVLLSFLTPDGHGAGS